MLLRDTTHIALAESENDPNVITLDKSHIKAVGFDEDQGLLPYSSRSNLGFRLLTEFFSFPEKFLFFEVTGLSAENLSTFNDKLNLYFYLKEANKDLEQHIHAENFALGCTPVVNLFPKTSYLDVEQEFINETKNKVAELKNRFNIGLSWKSFKNRYAKEKSLELEELINIYKP